MSATGKQETSVFTVIGKQRTKRNTTLQQQELQDKTRKTLYRGKQTLIQFLKSQYPKYNFKP